MAALLLSAFQLHVRASKLEQRERSLEARINAFSRLTREHQEVSTERIERLAASWEALGETPTNRSSRARTERMDNLVQRAGFQAVSNPASIPTPKD